MTSGNVETVRKIQSCWQNGRLDEIDQYFAPDFEAQSIPSRHGSGIAGAKAFYRHDHVPIADRTYEEVEIIEDSLRVFIRNRISAVNSGGVPFADVPANGRRFVYEAWAVYRFNSDGKVISQSFLNDAMAVRHQVDAGSQSS